MYLIIHFGVIYFTVITRYQIINNNDKFNMKIIERTISTERQIKKYKSHYNKNEKYQLFNGLQGVAATSLLSYLPV